MQLPNELWCIIRSFYSGTALNQTCKLFHDLFAEILYKELLPIRVYDYSWLDPKILYDYLKYYGIQSRYQFTVLTNKYSHCYNIFIDYLRYSRIYLPEFIEYAWAEEDLSQVYKETRAMIGTVLFPTPINMPPYLPKEFQDLTPKELCSVKLFESKLDKSFDPEKCRGKGIKMVFSTLEFYYETFCIWTYSRGSIGNCLINGQLLQLCDKGINLQRILEYVEDGSPLQKFIIYWCGDGNTTNLFSAFSHLGQVKGLKELLNKFPLHKFRVRTYKVRLIFGIIKHMRIIRNQESDDYYWYLLSDYLNKL